MVNAQAVAWQKWFKGKMCNSDTCPSDATLKTYGYSMNWLQSRMEGFDVDKEMAPEPDTILSYMDDNKVKTNRRLASYTAMKVFHRCKGQSVQSKCYCTPLIICKRQQDAEYHKQRRTAHQSKNWVEFKVIKKFAAELRKSSGSHGEMIAMLPREGRLRHEAFSMLEQSIDGRIGGSLRRFTAMKLYLNQEPTETMASVRKFKGANSLQVIVNLSDFGYRFFRFHGKEHKDIDIDSMRARWSEDIDEYIKQLENEIRMYEMSYFRRIREAAETGTIYLLLPRGPERRKRTMECFLTVLDQVPTGSIDLRNSRIRRIYPDATKTGEIR